MPRRNPLDEALADMMDAWMEMMEVLPMQGIRKPTMSQKVDKHTTFGEWEDRNGEVSITVDMPGVERKDIKLSVDTHMVSVEANAGREYNFQHEFPLITLNPDEVTAKLNNGVLDIKIKKAEDSVGKSIEIE